MAKSESSEKSIATTRLELARLIDDRKNDPSVATLNHPRPSWMLDADDPVRRHIRIRERRIRYLENRLDGASQNFEREFDQNS